MQSFRLIIIVSLSDPQLLVAEIIIVFVPEKSCKLISAVLVDVLYVVVETCLPLSVTVIFSFDVILSIVAFRRKAGRETTVFVIGLVEVILGFMQFS